jgi:hypothetical protein
MGECTTSTEGETASEEAVAGSCRVSVASVDCVLARMQAAVDRVMSLPSDFLL